MAWAGYAACTLYVAIFAALWAARIQCAPPRATALSLALLPSVTLAAILLDAVDLAAVLRVRLPRLRAGSGGRLARTRTAGLVLGKLVCWLVVPAFLLSWGPGLWSEASGENLERPRLQVLANGRELFVEGPIARGFAARLAETIARNPGLRSLSLESEGGLVGEAVAARAVVAARGLDTYVEGLCASACVDLFLGGRRREALGVAHFRLHHPGFDLAAFRLSPSGAPPPGFLAGLPEPFRARALATGYDSDWEPGPGELLAAGVVTAYVDGSGHALIPRAAWRTQGGLRAALVRPTLLAALGPGLDGAVDEALSEVARAMREARPHREASERLRRAMARLALARVAGSGDAAVRGAGELAAEAMDASAGAAPDLCARIGARADLVAVQGVLRAAGRPGDPVLALLAAAGPEPGRAVPRPAPADAPDPGPAGDCADQRAFYAAALAGGRAGLDGLRARFAALAASPGARVEASAD